MKKAIAAILSMFVGLYGYAIVDEALENRVKNLEYAVSSQEECINSLHGLGAYSTTYTMYTLESSSETTSTTELTTTRPTTIPFDGTYRNVGKQTKFMFRLYSNGVIKYVETGIPLRTTTYPSSTTLPDEYEEYFTYITESSAVVTSTEQTTSMLTYYNDNYDNCSSIEYENRVYATVTVKGYTDEIFAGKTISMDCSVHNYDSEYSLENVTKNNGIIAENGSFEIIYVYRGSGYPSSYARYNIYALNIF